MRKMPGAAMGAAERGRVRAASARAAGFRSRLLPAPGTACTTAPCSPKGAHSRGAPQLIPVGSHSSTH